MRAATRGTAVLLALTALALGAARAASRQPPDVVVIVVDTLRADRLGAYGNRRGLTPFLDQLARQAHVVGRAYAQAPWTNPSVASLFTSRYPSQHGILGFDSVLAADETTLAEVLRGAGYATGAFSANGLISQTAGFDQGFEHYRAHLRLLDPADRFTVPAKRAGEITNEALHWLESVRRERAGTSVFLYLHFMETHAPYAPPEAMLDQVRGTKPRLDVSLVNQAVIAANLEPLAPEVIDGIRDTYDAEVLAIDDALGRLLGALARRGTGERALVIITADHGEELLEHGGVGHGKTLYDEVLHVPLIVRTPGQTHGRVIERIVSSIDIAPTVLDEVGLESPSTFEGVSFARDLDAPDTATSLRRFLGRLWDDRPLPAAFSEHHAVSASVASRPSHQNSVVLGRNKLIAWTDGRRDFFALDDDPREQQPNRVEASARDALIATLDELHRRALQTRTRAEKQAIDPQTRDALRALGYTD